MQKKILTYCPELVDHYTVTSSKKNYNMIRALIPYNYAMFTALLVPELPHNTAHKLPLSMNCLLYQDAICPDWFDALGRFEHEKREVIMKVLRDPG